MKKIVLVILISAFLSVFFGGTVNAKPGNNNGHHKPTPTPTVSPTVSPTPTNSPTPTETPTPTPTPSVTHSISGFVFQDDNSNGVQESWENGIANYEVSAGRDLGHTTTDSNGYYVIVNPPGIYQMSIPPQDWKYIMTTPNYVDADITVHDDAVNFGLKLLNTPTVISVSVIPCGSTSCSGITTIKVIGSGFTVNTRIELVGSGVTGSYVGGDESTTILTDFINVPHATYNVRVYSATGDTQELTMPSAIIL